MRILLKAIAIFLILQTPCFAGVNNITEEDGSPSLFPWKMKFPNGSVTDNLDGTASVAAGAPTNADYLVGTANGSLSAEIVVGTSPGGELGGSWASPTIDDGLSVADWTMTGNFVIPQGSNPTVDAAGEVSVDTSATSGSMLRFYGDAAYALPGWQQKSFCITAATSAADMAVPISFPTAVTIRKVRVLCVGGTNWIGQLAKCDSNGGSCSAVDSSDITATAGTTSDDDGSLSAAGVTANSFMGIITTSVSGTNTRLLMIFYYTHDAVA